MSYELGCKAEGMPIFSCAGAKSRYIGCTFVHIMSRRVSISNYIAFVQMYTVYILYNDLYGLHPDVCSA